MPPVPSAGGIWTPGRRSLTIGLVLAVTLVAFEALAIATVLPVVSRQLGDLRLYGWVFSAFLLSSLIGIVVAGRAVQGLGAGVVPAVAYVAIARGYPDACRPRMFAVLSTAWVIPGLIGPAVAALVASAVGWRWVFLGLLPLVAVAGLLATLALRSVPRPAAISRPELHYLPVLGVVAGAGVALASLSSGQLPIVVAGVLAGGALLVVSLRRLTPPGTLL